MYSRTCFSSDSRYRVTAGENSTPGAIIDFYLAAAPKGETTIEILDSTGKRVRKYSSAKPKEPDEPLDADDEKPKKKSNRKLA